MAIVATFFLSLAVSPLSSAQNYINLVTDRSALGANDSLDWGILGGNGFIPPNPFTVQSVDGIVITATDTAKGLEPLEIQVQCSVPSSPFGCGRWPGNFAPGDNLLWVQFGGNPDNLVLTFSTPVSGAGMQIQSNPNTSLGPFTATIQAFNGTTLLGSFTENGNSNGAADNSAIFIGVLSSTANITSLVLSTTNPPGTPPDFAVNKLSLVRPFSLFPDHGGNVGTITPTIFGSGIPADSTAKLVCSGQSDILGTNNTVAPNGTNLTTTFDLTGAPPGQCSVVITQPDGSTQTVPELFTIEQGGAPQVWVDIIGPEKMRIGREETYYIVVGNKGNVDSSPGLVSLDVPSTFQYVQMSGTNLFAAGNTSDPEFQIPGPDNPSSTSLLFVTSGVSAGATQVSPIHLTVPSSGLTSSQLTISPSGPSSQFTLKVGWQQDLANLSLDDFLGLEGIPFIPSPAGGCPQCLNDYNAELLAHTDVLTDYLTLDNARLNLIDAWVNLPLALGRTVATGLAVTALASVGVPALILAPLGPVISQSLICVQNNLGIPSGQNCLMILKPSLRALRNAIALFLPNPFPGFPTPVQLAVKSLGVAVDLAIAATDAAGNIINAYGDVQAAFGKFQQSLGPYQIAQGNYQSCLSNTTCGQQPPPHPPNPPGTSLTVTPIQSRDPNDKLGSRGIGVQQYISEATPLRYAVYFANEDTATAPAQQVVITDQLDLTNDDLKTFSFGPIAFGNQLISPPSLQASFSTTVDLRPSNNLLVAVTANLDSSTGLVTWKFESLDPTTNQPPTDPTAGFLPPGGEGSVVFTVLPKQDLVTNTQIQNQATIVFDVNPPISTQTWLNTLDNDNPTSHVVPLPTTENSANFPVEWSGSDTGAGIQDFTIFVSNNDGPFTPWLTNTTETFASYPGVNGHTYGFFSQARDLVGNIEVLKTQAEVTTTVHTGSPPTAKCTDVTVQTDAGLCSAASASVNNGSSDPDGDAITLQQSPAGPYSLGTTAVTLTVTDTENLSASCSANVIVVDKQPPIIGAVSVSPNILWPPNNKLVPVSVAISDSDNCDSKPVCKITQITSNELITAVDAQTTSNLTANLSTQRLGNGTGRVYTLTVQCTDASGNSSTANTTVTVPHDQGN